MNENVIKKLSAILSKMPKKELSENIEKAKKIMKNSNKEDLKTLLESEQVSKLLGKDSEKIKSALEKTDLSSLDLSSLAESLNKPPKKEGD